MTATVQPTGSPVRKRVTEFVVLCRWYDSTGPFVTGAEALVLEAADANDALLTANALRPDLWEPKPGVRRDTAVHPVSRVEASQ